VLDQSNLEDVVNVDENLSIIGNVEKILFPNTKLADKFARK
jgi:hypothetical protein